MSYDEMICGRSLFVELQSIEDRGILIFLDGVPSSPEAVATAFILNKNISYMRDYIFEQGVLKELRFDKVCCM
jgi:hypothetical protein